MVHTHEKFHIIINLSAFFFSLQLSYTELSLEINFYQLNSNLSVNIVYTTRPSNLSDKIAHEYGYI